MPKLTTGRPGGLILLMSLAVLLTTAGCGDPAGTPCEVTGSGFQASSNCRHRCLSLWHVTCPNGERVMPNVCTGSFGCAVGGCPDGQHCYHDDDAFDDRSFCVVDTVCGALDVHTLDAWEQQRVAVQAEVRATRIERQARRDKWRAEHPEATKTTPALDP